MMTICRAGIIILGAIWTVVMVAIVPVVCAAGIVPDSPTIRLLRHNWAPYVIIKTVVKYHAGAIKKFWAQPYA